MDEGDMGNIIADRLLNQALASHKAGAQPSRKSRTHCLDCGEKIPEARRKAAPGCVRCMHCAAELERNFRR